MLFPDHQQPQLGQIFAEEMRTYSWSSSLEPFYSRLRATDHAILEVPDEYQSFSTALWELCFPSISEAELWHYTELDSLAGILKSREIWLHSLTKRMGEGEIEAFANEFDLLGLLSFDKDGRRVANELARDLFFLSLTAEDEPGDFWNYGEVRLRLKIRPINTGASLKKISYGDGGPLKILREFTQLRFDRSFIPWQISRQGAFFLDSYLSWETETRLLVKRFRETTDLQMRDSEGAEAVAIPINQSNSRVDIQIVRIEADTAASLEAAKGLLAAHADMQFPLALCTR